MQNNFLQQVNRQLPFNCQFALYLILIINDITCWLQDDCRPLPHLCCRMDIVCYNQLQ